MGRTLDYEFSYGDEVTVTPRNYPINFRFMGVRNNHYAMIGMASLILSCNDSHLYLLKYNVSKSKGMPGISVMGARLNSALALRAKVFLM